MKNGIYQAALPALVVLLVLCLYWPVSGYDFINYDDNRYVTENRHVQGGLSTENVIWAFTIHGPSMWVPLTWLSHQGMVELFGNSATAQHSLNILLHALNVALLFLCLRAYTASFWRSLAVSLIFALHPLHVESVAWITERKDVLCMLFILLSLLAYRRYCLRPRPSAYLLVCALHFLALMAKPMAVTIPCLMLLLDAWPLKRISLDKLQDVGFAIRRVLEKLPLLALSAFASWMTILCQQSAQAIASSSDFPLSLRLQNAAINYITYLSDIFVPQKLAVFYPYRHAPDLLITSSAIVLLLTVSGLVCWLFRKGQGPYFVGWFWYLGTFVPMIGLVQAGSHAMADRYTYLPAIGIYIATIWALAAGLSRAPKLKPFACACFLAWLGWISIVSIHQVQTWKNSETVFRQAIAATEGNYLAHNNLALALQKSGQDAEARQHLKTALEINPNYVESLNNMGIEYAKSDQHQQAVAHFQKAIALKPNHSTAHHNLGKSMIHLGRPDQAEALFQKALQINPDYSEAAYDYGWLLLQQQRFNEAEAQLRQVLQVAPSRVDAWQNLGIALFHQGQMEQAAQAYRKGLEIEPDNAALKSNLSLLEQSTVSNQSLQQRAEALRDQGQYEAAIGIYLELIEQDPRNADIYNDLGVVFGLQGAHETARLYFEQAVKADPDHSLARQNRAAAEAALMQTEATNKD